MPTKSPKPASLKAAAGWLARLNTTTISSATMEEYRTWRAEPDNHAAFRQIEGLWAKAGAARGEPGVEAALAAALSRPPPAPRAWLAPGLSIAAAALVVSLGGYFTWRALAAPLFSTAIGEQRLIRLSDGSSVRLDTDTRLVVRYSGKTRLIRLEHGQAFFDVAHDPDRPFLVTTPQATVRAVGTRFAVREDDQLTRVTLVQGRIEVRDSAAATPRVLTPGQQVVAATSLGPVRTVDPALATSWTTGRLIFNVVPLRQAVAEINRYSVKPVRLDPAYKGADTLSGAFDSADTDGVISAIVALRGLTAERQPDGSVLLRQHPDT